MFQRLTARRGILALIFTVLTITGFAVWSQATQAITASVWPSTVTPNVVSDSDSSSVELGMRFRANVAGSVTGVSFYKSSQNTGTHTGTLWSNTGTKLATVTFSGETASGWQTASFTTPVAITANTTYVVSYHAPKGHYSADSSYFATKAVTNGPLTALQDGTDGHNGVYKYSSSTSFPNTTYQATNYWVQPVFSYQGSTDTTPPTVTSVTPQANATSVPITTTITVTASESLNPATVSGAFTVKNSTGNTVAGTVSYADATKTITFTPANNLANSTTYTATLSTAVTDVAGNALATPYSWSFTSAAAQTQNTSVSLWAPAAQTVSTATSDTAAVEVGTRFSSDTAGSITALTFYKSSNDASSHTLTLWDSNGNSLATASTSNETASGWQTATLATPQNISAGATYTVSYTAPKGNYSYTSGALNTAYTNGHLTALANGGVYIYTPGIYPNQTFGGTNYWVDVAFSPGTQTPDTTPPTVTSVSPSNGATGVVTSTGISATFSEALNPASTTGSIVLADSSHNTVAGTTSYNGATHSITFTPTAALAPGTTYTATVQTTVTDVAGNALASPYSWGFTTAAGSSSGGDLSKGPGGPILVLNSSSNPFSGYYAEILRAEGLNSFDTKDIASVDATTLGKYQVAILGDESLTAAQVTLLTNWVNAGGNLIAMHPDKQLAPLAGLTPVSTTLGDSYLGIDTTQAPGAGITDQTIQYHGSADEYTAQAGTRTVATLYSSATASTAYPAVTVRSVGSNGGQVSVFTYDLARSVVYTHQGNPAWSGQERDGNSPIRPDDLFYGAKAGDVQPDYVDLNKVAIPQADEQQRLLSNIIEYTNQDNNPLPKFWYFPNDKKAVVVLASDDHATASGTLDYFNYLLSQSPANCSIANWTCYRATSYMYTSGPMTPTQAYGFENQGFDIGVHVSTGCADWTPASLDQAFTNDIAGFRAKYPSLPPQTGSRTHCIAWSDYDTTPQVEYNHGIRIDLNYYYWPGSWVQNRPGYFTGSGLDMRYASMGGNMFDVYQLPSHLVNESGQDFPNAINLQLDRAVGPLGYYGALGTHFDYSDNFGHELVDAAIQHNVPLVSVQQMLDWTDGRNASSLGTPTWSGNTLSFSATVDSRTGTMLRGMLPMMSKNGRLSTLTQGGTSVSFTDETIKGIEYAVFPVATGTYNATYIVDTTPPTVTAITPANGTTGVNAITTVSAKFSEALNPATVTTGSVQLLDTSGTAVPATVTYDSTTDGVVLTPNAPLSASTTYTASIAATVTDTSGNPLGSAYTWQFTTTAQTQVTNVSLWAPATPQNVLTATNDTSRVEIGTQFQSSVAGTISGITFYKTFNDASSHTVTLWDNATGTALTTGTTSNESATGWQTATFASPVSITAGKLYTVSYTAPTGRYSYTTGNLSSSFTNGYLSAPANGGVYNYGSGIPMNSYQGSNYWVDVIFSSQAN